MVWSIFTSYSTHSIASSKRTPLGPGYEIANSRALEGFYTVNVSCRGYDQSLCFAVLVMVITQHLQRQQKVHTCYQFIHHFVHHGFEFRLTNEIYLHVLAVEAFSYMHTARRLSSAPTVNPNYPILIWVHFWDVAVAIATTETLYLLTTFDAQNVSIYAFQYIDCHSNVCLVMSLKPPDAKGVPRAFKCCTLTGQGYHHGLQTQLSSQSSPMQGLVEKWCNLT